MAIRYLSGNDANEPTNAETGKSIEVDAFRAVFDASSQGVLVHQCHKPFYVNHAWAALHGFEPSEIMARGTVVDLLSPKDRDRMVIYNNDRLAGSPAPSRYHYQLVQKSGQLRWVEIFVQQMEWFGEQAVQCTVIDARPRDDAIAERLRRAEDTNERFHSALEEASEGFALYSEDHRLLVWNRRLVEMLPELDGVLKPDMTFEQVARIRLNLGTIAEAVGREGAWLEERLRSFGKLDSWIDMKKPDGRWCQISEKRLNDGCILVTAIDITDRKAMEITLSKHRDHLEELVANRTAEIEQQRQTVEDALDKERELSTLQRHFVSMVCHEFRTPLSVIDGSAQRILRRIDKIAPDRLRETLGKIRTSVSRLTDLMESVLSAARLESGTIKFEPRPCAPKDIILEITANYRELNPDYEIVANLDDLPEVFVMDGKLIRQVISNLLSNAIKYSPDSSHVWIEGQTTCQSGLRISVRDEGVGIPSSEVECLFERFFRASTSTGIAGTGIGLNMVKAFVEIHDGKVSVTSEEGVGTTFTIDLPDSTDGSTRQKDCETLGA